MLDASLLSQLRTHFERLTRNVTLVASLDERPVSRDVAELLEELSGLSDRIVVASGDDDHRPSFLVRGDEVGDVRFAGLPLGHEFTSLVLAILQVGGVAPVVDDATAERVRALSGPLQFTTYFSQSCQNCPVVVQALNAMAVLNPAIGHVAVDGGSFKEEVESKGILAVPAIYLNGELFGQGRMSIEEIVAKLDTSSVAERRDRLDAKEPFDVLVVGAGPAGAAAAIYAARKGIRTGIVAERFGGQVLDTAAIENLVSVLHTEGPELASALEAHVRSYDVDVMVPERVTNMVPAGDDGLIRVELACGATLRATSVILAPGARWRRMGVPGEQELLNKGVTFCPHCDGPLFKNKRIAVIGGGNSGVEAAIDLAGVVSHVTLIEFDGQLRADEVLQRKLRSLGNVDVLTSALTTEVLGETTMTGLRYEDRRTGATHELDVEGVFVQIGLVPNTEWLEGVVELSSRGEIVVNDRGATSLPGVFAAGDATTEAFKQIVVAMGTGSTAALSAFDHMIRTSAPENELV